MPKSKYVLVCLLWLLRCPLGSNTSHSNGLLLAKPQEKKTKSEDALPTDSVADNVSSPQEASDTTVSHAPDQSPQSEEQKALLAPTDAEETPSENTDQETIPPTPEGPIKATIEYNAEEAILFDIKNKTVRLYKEGIIEYDNIKLEAEEVALDWTNHTIEAFSKKSDAGEVEKKVVLTRDGLEYIAESVRYNFDSQRAVANTLFHKKDDGILRANRIKKDREDTFYADKSTYTTCNLTKPCFCVEAQRLKITQDDKVVSGPFQLSFDDVPIPLGFLTGIFYFPQGSGILFPQYGGESGKGFSLKGGGYYIKFNDYLDLALKGDVYSKGSTLFEAESQYKKRYQYNGVLNYERGTDIDPSGKEKFWRFQWKHNTENNRISSLTAEVDLQSSSFRGHHDASAGERLPASIISRIRYTNKLVGLPYTLNASLSYNKNFRSETQEATATIPNIVLNTEDIYPFRKKGKPGGNWYSDIYFRHTVNFDNKLSNLVDGTRVDSSPGNWPAIFKNGNYGVKHTVPLRTNIKILSYLNLTPEFQYEERWYWEKRDYKHQDDKGTKVKGFERVYDYSLSAKLATTLYGTYTFSQNATVQAIRHELESVVNFRYTPDFSDSKYGYWQTMENGKKWNRFYEGIYGTPSSRAKAEIAIKLNNRLDMKVKSNEDGEKSIQKVPILKGFNWSTGYDFLEDDFPLEDIKLDAYTSLFDDLFDIRFDSTFDPYIYRTQSRGNAQDRITRINEFAWRHGQGIGHVKEASVSIGTKFSPDGKNSILERYDEPEEEEEEETKKGLKHVQENPEQYVDFNIPWSIDLNYKWSYKSMLSEEAKRDDERRHENYWSKQEQGTNSLSFGGDVSLTEKWKLTFSSVYDISERELLGGMDTWIGVYRDLHCWEMNFKWHPLGDVQRYEFSIGLKSPLLQALRYERNKVYNKR